MDGVKLSSVDDHSENPYALASPVIPFPNQPAPSPHPARIQCFVRHSFQTSSISDSIHVTRTFAVVKWPQVHPRKIV